MMIIIFVIAVMITFVILSVIKKDKINEYKIQVNENITKVKELLPEHTKKNFYSTLVAIIITLMIYTLPYSIIVILFMQFPVRMLMGQINLIFTFVTSFTLLIVFEIIRTKILNGYIKQANETGTEVPCFSLSKVFYTLFMSVFNVGIICAFVLVMYFILLNR